MGVGFVESYCAGRVGVRRTRIELAGLQFVFRDRALRNSRLGEGIRPENVSLLGTQDLGTQKRGGKEHGESKLSHE